MRIAVLAASGATGRHLVTQAYGRGHTVLALARDPARLDLPALVPTEHGTHLGERLRTAAVDVTRPSTLTAALATAGAVDAVVSGLGAVKGSPRGLLTSGAQALADAHADDLTGHLVWLSAWGTGASAGPAGPLTRALLRAVLGADETTDKAAADALLLPLGASVLHAGPLTNRRLSTTRRTLALPDAPRHLIPRPVTRATVAAAMLDEAERPRFAGAVAVPLT